LDALILHFHGFILHLHIVSKYQKYFYWIIQFRYTIFVYRIIQSNMQFFLCIPDCTILAVLDWSSLTNWTSEAEVLSPTPIDAINSLEEIPPEDSKKLDKENVVTLRNEQVIPSRYKSSRVSNIRKFQEASVDQRCPKPYL